MQCIHFYYLSFFFFFFFAAKFIRLYLILRQIYKVSGSGVYKKDICCLIRNRYVEFIRKYKT